MSQGEDVFSQRCFSFTLRDKTYVQDPFKIRRSLLETTHGRTWSAIQAYNQLSREIKYLREELDRVQNDLRVKPPTPEEINPPAVEVPEGEQPPPRPPTRLDVEQQLIARLAVSSLNFVRYEAGLASAAYQAFELAPFDSETKQGFLESEVLDVLAAFVTWAEKKDKRFGG